MIGTGIITQKKIHSLQLRLFSILIIRTYKTFSVSFCTRPTCKLFFLRFMHYETSYIMCFITKLNFISLKIKIIFMIHFSFKTFGCSRRWSSYLSQAKQNTAQFLWAFELSFFAARAFNIPVPFHWLFHS